MVDDDRARCQCCEGGFFWPRRGTSNLYECLNRYGVVGPCRLGGWALALYAYLAAGWPMLVGLDAAERGSGPVDGLDLAVLDVVRKRVTLMRGNER